MKIEIDYLKTYELLLEEKEYQFGLSVAEHGGLKSFLLFDKDLHIYAAAGIERYGEYEEIQFINGTDNKIKLLVKIITSFIYPRKLMPNREHVDIFEFKAFLDLYNTSGIESEVLPKSLQKKFDKSLGDSAQHKNYYLNMAYSGKTIGLDILMKAGRFYLDNANTSHDDLLDKTIGI